MQSYIGQGTSPSNSKARTIEKAIARKYRAYDILLNSSGKAATVTPTDLYVYVFPWEDLSTILGNGMIYKGTTNGASDTDYKSVTFYLYLDLYKSYSGTSSVIRYYGFTDEGGTYTDW